MTTSKINFDQFNNATLHTQAQQNLKGGGLTANPMGIVILPPANNVTVSDQNLKKNIAHLTAFSLDIAAKQTVKGGGLASGPLGIQGGGGNDTLTNPPIGLTVSDRSLKKGIVHLSNFSLDSQQQQAVQGGGLSADTLGFSDVPVIPITSGSLVVSDGNLKKNIAQLSQFNLNNHKQQAIKGGGLTTDTLGFSGTPIVTNSVTVSN